MVDSTDSNQEALRPSAGDMLIVDIAKEIARMKKEPTWAASDRLAGSLVKDIGLNVMLLTLKAGAKLAEHHTKGPLALYVLSGEIRFGGAGRETLAAAGNLLALDRDVPHHLEAISESALLLITAMS